MSDADALTRLLHAVDRLDWSEVRRSLAGEVRVDYAERHYVARLTAVKLRGLARPSSSFEPGTEVHP